MPEKSSVFVAEVDTKLSAKMLNDLKEQNFDISTPPYTVFSAKKKGVSCTLYQSGKLTVQGKEMADFIEFYLEPEILKTFSYNQHDLVDENVDLTPRIGIDESGKGDFFGPLCIAGVYAGGEEISKLNALGVKDSKKLSDPAILKIAKEIRSHYQHHVVKINPLKYNELYAKFGNLNHLLAWGHATAIEQLVGRTQCHNVIIDQFAAEEVVISALLRKRLEVNLTQRHRGEEDIIVAAASILAREAFVEGLRRLGEEFSIKLPKGASNEVIQAGKMVVANFGHEALKQVCKIHFKTFDVI